MNAPSTIADDYASNATMAQVARRIREGRRIGVVSHSKADGDSLGSMLAIARALTNAGQIVDVYLMGPVEPNLLRLAGDTPVLNVESLPNQTPPDDYDTILIVDTGAWSQVEAVEPWLRRHHDKVVGIDHHAHGDDVAAMRIVDASKASTTQILVDLLDELGCRIDGGNNSVAEALFLGLATDSGWFRHSNAGAEVFAVAARLLACGVDKTRLHQIIEESHRPQRLSLEARALSSIIYSRSGTVAIMSLSLKDFEETGGSVEDLTGMVNLPLVVGNVQVSILLAQTEPGKTKASFRSKSAIGVADPDELLDVNELAQQFGGGGHFHAAGARFSMDLAQALDLVRNAVEP